MERPLIGLTTYGRNGQDRYELQATYSWAVYRAGGLPVLLPPVGNGVLAAAWLAKIDGLILSGGGDLDPALYGGEMSPTIYSLDRERDQAELALAREALKSDKPILAICRGLQVINIAMHGTLYPHLPDEYGEQVAHRLPPREPSLHPVCIVKDCRLAGVLRATEVEVVSWHHQSIRDLAPGLIVTGRASDGVIEAIEAADSRWLIGVQWHPEMSAERDPVQQRLFDGLVAAVQELRSATK